MKAEDTLGSGPDKTLLSQIALVPVRQTSESSDQLEATAPWSALTCQRFVRSRPVAASVCLSRLKECGVKLPQTKALTGQRTAM